MKAPRVYLLDVEGTTSPVSLVYEQLYPYAYRHLEPFLSAQLGVSEIQADLVLLAKECRAETVEGAPVFAPSQEAPISPAAIPEVLSYLHWLMDQDRKSTALKSLQGKIWRSGYLAGELQGTVFPDVPAAFDRWSQHAKVAIYSSGSVESQKLLFQFSTAGNLTPLISSFFDTRIGPKTSMESYRTIAAAMDVPPNEILFVSDLVRELDPAREAGCATRLSVREGNQRVSDGCEHLRVTSFHEIP